MKIARSKRALEVLRFIIENEDPKTLYEIGNQLRVEPASSSVSNNTSVKKKKIPWGSLELAIHNLKRKNLITLDLEKSKQKGRNATIFVPTFKGLLAFLEKFSFPQGTILEYNADKTAVNIKTKIPQEEKKNLDKILERHGKRLQYPLFEQVNSLKLRPRLYELFIKIAKEVLIAPVIINLSSRQQFLLDENKRIQKRIENFSQTLGKGRFVTLRDGKEYPFDPVVDEKRQLEWNEDLLNLLNSQEDEFLREFYFLTFLKWMPYFKKKPNKELFDYTQRLLKKKKQEFDILKKELERGLSFFENL